VTPQRANTRARQLDVAPPDGTPRQQTASCLHGATICAYVVLAIRSKSRSACHLISFVETTARLTLEALDSRSTRVDGQGSLALHLRIQPVTESLFVAAGAGELHLNISPPSW